MSRRGGSLSAIVDQIEPDTCTLREWRRARGTAKPECDVTPAQARDQGSTWPRSNQHPRRTRMDENVEHDDDDAAWRDRMELGEFAVTHDAGAIALDRARNRAANAADDALGAEVTFRDEDERQVP